MKIKKLRAINVILILFCMSFQNIVRAGIALFLPAIRKDLGLSFTQGGAISAAGMFTYALTQIPAGYLADRYGLKRLFFIGILGTTTFCFLFGWVSEYWQALLNLSVSGLFRAFSFASGVALLAGWFGPKRRATAMGLSLIGLFLGQLILNTLGPGIVERLSWRYPFIMFASVGIPASLAYVGFAEKPPHENSGRRIRIIDVFRLFKHPFMWVVGVVQYIRLGVFSALSFWLPSLLIEEKGLSMQITGLIIALRTVMSAPSNMIGGYVSDRIRNPFAVIAVSLAGAAITTALMMKADAILMIIVLNAANAVFIQAYFGPLFAIPLEKYGSHMTGTLTGFGNFFANLGGFSSTYLLGFIKDRTGFFEAGFYSIAAACLFGLAAAFLLKKMAQTK